MPAPDDRPDEPLRIGSRDARGAEIILRKRRYRAFFIGALVLFVILAVVLRFAG